MDDIRRLCGASLAKSSFSRLSTPTRPRRGFTEISICARSAPRRCRWRSAAYWRVPLSANVDVPGFDRSSVTGSQCGATIQWARRNVHKSVGAERRDPHPRHGAEDLPLFSAGRRRAAPEPPRESAAEDLLPETRPDELTPREELDLVYRLKGMVMTLFGGPGELGDMNAVGAVGGAGADAIKTDTLNHQSNIVS
jgi:hypothetical protein